MQQDYDIVIIGGGMVGASLAVALADTSYRIAVVEPVQANAELQPSYDDRGIALSLSSKRVFEGLGLWPRLAGEANPIKHIHVSDRGHFGKVRMDAQQLGLDALGYVVVARELGSVLLQRLQSQANVDFLCPARLEHFSQNVDGVSLQLQSGSDQRPLDCRLMVAADGTESRVRRDLAVETREHDYRQSLVVSKVSTERPHENTAYERFTEDGPLALLPLGTNQFVLVFSVPANSAESYMAMPEEDFLAEVGKRMGRRLGRFYRLGKRRLYPVKSVLAQQQLAGRVILLGNSAHTIHPNGAQGFNLCLRDVASLAEKLQQGEKHEMDPGSAVLLADYLQERKADQARVSEHSHNISRWFYNRSLALSLLRNLALTVLDLTPAVRREIMLRGTGLSGRQPALVRGTSA